MDTFYKVLGGIAVSLVFLIFVSWLIQMVKNAAVETGRKLVGFYFASKMEFLENMEKKFGDGPTANRAVSKNFN